MRNDHNYTVYALAAFALFFCMAFVSAQLTGCSGPQSESVLSLEESDDETDASPEAQDDIPVMRDESSIFVYICGAVERPGVYELPDESRIYELLSRCGGYLPEADHTYLNQAEQLSDGEKIFVPKAGEGAADETAPPADERVNINTADTSLLTTISGIGPSRAADIVSYREANGNFAGIEDIMKVPGIKEGLFSRIKDQIKT